MRLAHLTTVDMSLALLLRTELEVDVQSGIETFGLSAPGPWVSDVEALGVTHTAVPSLTRSWSPRGDLRATRELAAVVRRLRLDVLHTHNPKTGVLGRVIGRLAGVPVVVNTCHGLWATPADPVGRRLAVSTLEVAAAAFSHAELYQNDTDRRALAGWVPRHKARLVGNGTDLTAFVPDPDGRARVRTELGVADDEVLVGGVGRLVAEKGVGDFCAAARSLGDRAAFVWVGPPDPDKPDAVAGGEGPVRFLGARADMPAVLNALDVFVLPSYREGFSRSAMEAAACGRAMVLSDIRGCREIGRHGRELLLVPPGRPEDLTDAVSLLVADASLRARLGAAARIRALAAFDQRQVAAASLRTYADVARRRGLGWESGVAS